MTPIISPWVFYFMTLAEKICDVALAVILFGGGTMLFLGVMAFTENEPFPKWGKGLLISLILALIVFIFIPSEKIITKMIIAQNVTYERVEVAADTVETVYNDIMELFDNEESNED